MLTYRQIESEPRFAKQIWRVERSGPAWFVEASNVWTPTYRSFRRFWKSCGEIWGLFDDDRLMACVYLAFGGPRSINIHVSVIAKLPEDEIVRFFKSLTAHQGENGVTDRTAWILSRNRFLAAIAEKTGYHPTGLKMDYGMARGRVLRWVEYRG